MNIGLQTWGSEGDINPFIALAAGLVKEGHKVKLCITEVSQRNYSEVANEFGFELINVPNPILPSVDMMAQMAQAFKAINDPSDQLKIINKYFLFPAQTVMFEAAKELCKSSDVVVRHIFCYPTQLAAELENIPVATLYPVHNIVPNRAQAPFGAVNLGAWAIPLWWKIAQWLINRIFLNEINQLRTQYSQKPNRDVLTQAWCNDGLNLIAVSPAICPPAIVWPKTFKICGFLNPSFFQKNQVLTPQIEEFLNQHPSPLYFTFGSMIVPNEASWLSVYEIWLETVRELGCSAIFQLPISDSRLLTKPDNVLIVQRAPHNLVFPHCSGIVHHGGAGTTQASLLAACPSVVVAHIADQPFWASELKRLGVSPGFMRRAQLSSRRLKKLIELIFKNSSYRQNAISIAQSMKNENSNGLAIEALSEFSKKNGTAQDEPNFVLNSSLHS